MKKTPPLNRKEEILEKYQIHLREVAGLSPKTCQNHSCDISRFLDSAPVRRRTHLSEITPVDLVTYFTAQSAKYQPASLRQVAGSVRKFLKFAHQKGWTTQPLGVAVPKIARRVHHDLPAYLSEEQLALLLGCWDCDTAEGKRDFAIGLCLARLGMRAGEVAAIRLEDLDWRQGFLRVNQSKNGRSAQMPLLAEVGEGIAAYLREGRPGCRYRQAFLFHNPPRPMNSEAISSVIRRALHHCGIEVPRAGAHLLRHTLASHLIQNGSTLKEVADVLRHRHLNSAAVYAHVDLAQLRSVAQAWRKEVIL